MRGMQACNYLRKLHLSGSSQCAKSGQMTQVHDREVPNSSEKTQGRSSTVNRCEKCRARPLMEGPQTSERVSRQKANRDTKMDPKPEAPCLTLTFESSLLVMVWRGPRSQLAAQPAPCFFWATHLESTSCRTYLFNNLIYSVYNPFSY